MLRPRTAASTTISALLLPLLLLVDAVVLASAIVSGFHVDDEICSGLLHDNKTAQLPRCAKFLGSLANLSIQMQHLSTELHRPQPLKLAADAGVGWVCPQQQPCTPPYCGCFNISFGGSSKSVADHVVDLADETILMDYSTVRSRPFDPSVKCMALGCGWLVLLLTGTVSTDMPLGVGCRPLPPCTSVHDHIWATQTRTHARSASGWEWPCATWVPSRPATPSPTRPRWRTCWRQRRRCCDATPRSLGLQCLPRGGTLSHSLSPHHRPPCGLEARVFGTPTTA
jgi:hypothetical protein